MVIVMNSIPAMNSGITGIQQGYSNLKQDAQQIASNQGTVNQNTEKALVGLIQDRNQVAASVEVVKAADETIGSLLDVMA